MAKTAFVTGVSGFTGGWLAKRLVERGYDVRGLVRDPEKAAHLRDLGVTLLQGDLREKDSFAQAVKGTDVVFHVAAAYRQEGVPNNYFWEVNVEGTRNLLEAAKEAGVRRFVHTSTVGVQGEIANPPATEEAPFNPGDVYQESKKAGELLARKFFEENALPGVVVRPVGIYGPGDTRFLKIFRFVYNGKFRMIGSGKVLYHLTFVDDLVQGIILAGEKEEAVGQVYTIGGPEFTTLEKLVELIAEVLDVPVPRKRLPVWPFWVAGLLCEGICRPLRIEPPIYRRRLDFFTKDRAFDISKARRELGYEPKISLKTGLKITGNWYKQVGWLDK